MNILGTLTFASGALLIYCAVKDKTPAEVIREMMGQKPAATPASGSKAKPATAFLIPPAQKFVSP